MAEPPAFGAVFLAAEPLYVHIERQLGAGGVATVYLARDLKHDRDVAVGPEH